MNYKLIQKALDRVATQFDDKGYKDLADKVDHYSVKLAKATDGQKTLIAKALKVINREANKRDLVEAKKAKKTPATTSKSRVNALRRKMALRSRKRAGTKDTSKLAKMLKKYDAEKGSKNLRAKRKDRLAK